MLLTSGHEVVGDVGSSTVFRTLTRGAKSEFGVFAFPEKTPTVSLGRGWAVSRDLAVLRMFSLTWRLRNYKIFNTSNVKSSASAIVPRNSMTES